MEIRFMAIGSEKGTEERKEKWEKRREEQISLSPPTTNMSSSTSSADLESRLGQGLDTDEAARPYQCLLGAFTTHCPRPFADKQ